MCGIYGTTLRYSNEAIKQKLSLMQFRGPDHQEYTSLDAGQDHKVTLGHVRLSIMDLDPRSNQPFSFNERITIVFNGEIYNFEQLKRQYFSDRIFRTTSDTEVLCAMYEKFGADCVQYFNGMFSFVIFDRKKEILFGARDRLGKKPFYYRWDDCGFEFASQPNPILYGNDFQIDEKSRSYMLFLGYIPDPYCIWKEIRKLRAGESFTYKISNNKLEIRTYWDIFANSYGFTVPKSYEEAKETVHFLIDDAVKIRLHADVPVGMFLSGGIDSSLTAAFIARANKSIYAYSIGFNDSRFDESNHAVSVAKSLDIPIKVNKCEGMDMLGIFNDYYKYYDEPFADFSLIPTSLLAQKTREDVTVAIGGDGGDELFYGYGSYPHRRRMKRIYAMMPYLLRRLVYYPLRSMDFKYADNLFFRDEKEEALCGGGYGRYRTARNFDIRELGYSLPDAHYLDDVRGWLQYSDFDMKQYMNSCINTKTDRASMRSSLELRSPLMDYRLAEYSRLLPYDYLYNKQTGGKRILKDILYEMVPREILERPKQGFAAPVGQWFKNELREKFLDILSYENVKAFLPELKADKLIAYRDNFIKGCSPTLIHTSFFKVYSYINWYLNVL